jgi:hypothetical protein
MTSRRLRTRLDWLGPAAAPERDRDQDRRRRDELEIRTQDARRLGALTDAEAAEPNARFHHEDRGRSRLLALAMQNWCGLLTDAERHELAALEKRLPPTRDAPVKDAVAHWRRAQEEWAERNLASALARAHAEDTKGD